MLKELERGIGQEMGDILHRAGEQIVHADYGVALEEQTVAHMRADKTRSSRNDDSQTASF